MKPETQERGGDHVSLVKGSQRRRDPQADRPHIKLHDLNLLNAERSLVQEALARTGSLVEAAKLLGTDRHALRRLIAKHNVEWWPYAQQQERWRGPSACRAAQGSSRLATVGRKVAP